MEKRSGFPRSLEVSPRGRHCHVGPYPWTEETPATRFSRTECAEKIPKAAETKSIETTPVTTKKLASDGGFEELLKKNGRVSLNDPLVTLGATKQPLSVSLERVDNNPQVFLGVQDKKAGETKSFLIPDFVSIADYNGSVEDEQEIGGATDACIILRLPRSKLKLENISLSTWVAANGRIMHNLTNTGT